MRDGVGFVKEEEEGTECWEGGDFHVGEGSGRERDLERAMIRSCNRGGREKVSKRGKEEKATHSASN